MSRNCRTGASKEPAVEYASDFTNSQSNYMTLGEASTSSRHKCQANALRSVKQIIPIQQSTA